ncbi:prepilin peptidase [Gryllotalpicola protaetiae]|uniref:Prepilin leader peptidase/N-methyltransferase n=1 Tax=Gryllotalpicola protaetiae TaxID=2419771 RepID=A0A387BWI9_9MICO|nr:A24 family peptidase [Gryllotalpicola protaetiae]AYG05279.1 prepilin peptidase [Gryllotalpicola protaetiae]
MPAIALGIFGSLIGSFLNVVVYRVPAGLSIVSPPSACPRCGEPIKGYDNIPLLSWLMLRAKCRHCGESISARYPLVELGTGLAFAAVAVWFALTQWQATDAAHLTASILSLVAFLYLAAISIALALIDLDTHKLPNAIVLPSYLVGGVLLGAASVVTRDWAQLVTMLAGGAALFALYFVIAFISPRGMGFGDVKLAGVLGLFLGHLGVAQLVVGAFAAFLLGGLFAIVLLVARRAGRKSGIPFGPWMLAGAWLGAIAGAPLAGAYLSLIGLTT